MFTLNCKGKLLHITEPIVMGIINVTPDSFYEGSRKQQQTAWLNTAAQMLEEGAAILDIGGQSTRPGSEAIGVQEEMDRVLPAIAGVHHAFPEAILSIDTYHHQVAKAAVEAGASIVNDISAGNMDEAMIATVADLQVPYIAMHMKGTPATMQQQAKYHDIATEVLDYFITKLETLKKAGMKDIVVDPGFGFGKTIEQNFELLKKMHVLHMLNAPILAGLSRKSTIWKTLNITPKEALNGTTVLNTLALQQGASILRVHDVKEAVEAIKLYQAFKKA
ncbi:MAG: dihydropteroate synthase [Chitinophagaceae bacterium]